MGQKREGRVVGRRSRSRGRKRKSEGERGGSKKKDREGTTDKGGKGSSTEESQQPSRYERKKECATRSESHGEGAEGRRGRSGVKPRDGGAPARERNIFPGGTRITVETRKIMKLVLKSVRVNII